MTVRRTFHEISSKYILKMKRNKEMIGNFYLINNPLTYIYW